MIEWLNKLDVRELCAATVSAALPQRLRDSLSSVE